MSREVDERVVAMYFDNKNFEKNAKTTIETLGELKSSMNMEKAAKGFDVLKKASEDLKLDDIGRKAKDLQSTFKTLGSTLSNVFKIGSGPLNSLHTLFNTFQSYVTKFIGFDLAGKLVGSLENALRQLTIAPISAGFQEYELKMDSIKTIMSGSGESLDVVKEKLEELNRYADQTVYSFSDMTSNIGKFTNNKVKLDDATAAMKGIANATADAGQGAQQASMAMYNISQAFGVGSMKMIDWKSLENANIATVRLKDAFIQAGVASGKLVKKIEKDAKSGENVTKYYVKGFEKGQKAVEVTAENFRETLNKEWLDKDTMLNTFKIYSGELKSIADVRRLGFTEALGFSDEDIQKLLDIGSGAMNAATEVRTFTKMYDALKEAAQSGWAETMELIFGDMEEATGLWTTLNDKISEVLENAAEARNAIFGEWRGMYRDNDGNLHESEDLYITEYEPLSEKERTAAEERRRKLKEDIARLEAELRKKDASANKKGKQSEDDLMEAAGLDPATRAAYQARLEDLKNELMGVEKELLGRPVQKQIMQKQEDGRKVLIDSFFEMIDILKDIGGTFTTAWSNVFGKFDSKKLWAITNGFRDFTKNLRNWLGTADDSNSRLSKITKGLQGVFSILKVVVNFFKGQISVLSEIAKPFVDLAVEAFGKFGEFFEGLDTTNLGTTISSLGTSFTNLWNKLETMNWDTVRNKFATVWTTMKENVRKWMSDNGLGDAWETIKGWKDSIVSQFNLLKTDLDTAWNSVTKWFKDSGISAFFMNLWNTINSQFQSKMVFKGANVGWKKEDAPIVAFFKGIPASMEEAWNSATGWKGWAEIGGFFTEIWKSVSSVFESGTGENGEIADAPIVAFFKGIPASMEEAWGTVTKWFDDSGISQFFTNLWDKINEQFQSKWVYHGPIEGYVKKDAPFVAFFKSIPTAMTEAWGTVTQWFDDSGIGQFFTNLWYKINEQFKPKMVFKGANVGWKKEDAPIVAFFKGLKDDLVNVWNDITTWSGWAEIGKFFTDAFGWLTDVLSGTASAEETTGEGNPAGGVVAVVESINEAASGGEEAVESVSIIQQILTAISGFFDDIGEFIGTVTKTTGADKAFETVHKIIEIFSTVITEVVNVLHKLIVKGEVDWRLIAAAIAGIGTIITTIYANKLRSKIASALAESEGIGQMFMRISIGILAVAGAVALLTTLDNAKMWEAVGAIAVIGLIVGAITVGINKLTQSAPSTDKPVTPLERIANNAIKWAGAIGAIWVAMKELPTIINAMKGSGVSGEDISQVMLSIIELVGGISLIVAVASKIGGGDIGAMSKAALSIVAAVSIVTLGLVTIFTGLSAAADTIGGKGTTDNMIESAKKTGALLTAITEAIGSIFVGFATGGKQKVEEMYGDLAMDNLERTAEMAEAFTPERLMALVRFVDTMQKVGDSLPDDIRSIGDFANKLPDIGTNMAKFLYNFRSFFDTEGAEFGSTSKINETREQLHSMIKLMQDMAELIQYVRVKGGFGSGWDSNTEQKFKNFGELSQRIIEMIQEGLGDTESLSLQFNATPIVDSIVVALGYGETAIAKAVHAMVQAGIDYSNDPQKGGQYNTEALTALLNGGLTLPTGENGPNLTGKGGLLNMNTLFGEGGLQGLMTSAFDGLNVESLSTDMSTQLGGLSEQFKSMFTLDDMQTQLSNFLPTGEDGNIDTDGILAQFQEQIDTLNQELDTSGANTVTIRPVFDATDLNAGIAQINDYFKENPVSVFGEDMPAQITFNLDNNGTINEIRMVQQGITNIITQIHAENAANMETIASLSRNINSVADAVYAMKIYLDTGVLAGAVDDELGLRMLLAGRTG